MKKMLRRISFISILMSPFATYAEESERLDQTMLEGILTFLRYTSYPILVIAIGMFIYSMKNEDGAMKTDSLKVFGIAVFLYSLLIIAKASGLCWLIKKRRLKKPW